MQFPDTRWGWGRPADTLLAGLDHLEIGCADPAVTADF